MPVLSKLKRWLCCGIGDREIEPPYEAKAVKKHIRRGLVPPDAALRRPLSKSCPAKLNFASVSFENGSRKRYECRASGDNSAIQDADNDSSESRKGIDEIADYPSVMTKENNADSKDDDSCSGAISLENCSTINKKEKMEQRILLVEQLDTSSGSDNAQINSISENQVEAEQDQTTDECSLCIPEEDSPKGQTQDINEECNNISFTSIICEEEIVIPATCRASDAEKDGSASPTQTEPADPPTSQSMLHTEHGAANSESLHTVQCGSSTSVSACGDAKLQKSSLKDKITAFSNLGFGRSALYCRTPQRCQLKTNKVPTEDSDDEEGQRIWGRTRRPRSLARNREDSPWLQARARTPASRLGRNYRPIYHALQRTEGANQKRRRNKSAEWLSAREVMNMANLKRKFRLTKSMRHCRLTLRNVQILRTS